MDGIEKTTSALWNDYLFLTKEMEKFLDKPDLDLFYELVSQRERLQSMIESRQQQFSNEEPPGDDVVAEIHRVNQVVTNKLRYAINREDHHHNISLAYDGYGSRPIGMGMDWKS